jgi:phosphoglycolate phosphatase
MQDLASAWPRAVSVDLDGTLVDTVEDLAAALNQTLVELGLSPVRSMVGGGLSKLLGRALARRQQGCSSLRGKASRAVPPLPRFGGDLARFACGRRRLRCTNKPDGITRDLLQALGVGKAFGCILGNTAGLPKKPDPTGIHRVLAGLNAEPTATVMVGDSAIRPMRSAPMPSSTRSTSFPPPLPCLLGGEGNPLDISNVCHCRAGPGNLVASADFCVYWIDRLRRQ